MNFLKWEIILKTIKSLSLLLLFVSLSLFFLSLFISLSSSLSLSYSLYRQLLTISWRLWHNHHHQQSNALVPHVGTLQFLCYSSSKATSSSKTIYLIARHGVTRLLILLIYVPVTVTYTKKVNGEWEEKFNDKSYANH